MSFSDGHLVALAYPDILFEPKDAFASLLERQNRTDADVVLGLFPYDIPEQVDMVVLDGDSKSAEIVIKKPDRGLRYSWSIAVWTPAFSDYMSDYVAGLDDLPARSQPNREPSVGQVIHNALIDGLTMEAVIFEQGGYIDIGTPEDLVNAQQIYSV